MRRSEREGTDRTSYASPIDFLDGLDPSDPLDDPERLARTLLDFAVVLLRRKGRFFPFGAVVWSETGEVQLAAAPAERGASNDPAALLDALVAELTTEASLGKIRAAATCGDVRSYPELGSVIRIDVETADGDVRCALQPYRRLFPRRFVLDADLVERPGVLRGIFPLTR